MQCDVQMQCESFQSSIAVSEVSLSEHAPVVVLKAAAAPPVVKQASIPEGDFFHAYICSYEDLGD